MVSHRRIEVLPARFAERVFLFVSQFLVQSSQKSLIVDAHGFEEAKFELLAVTAELSRKSIPLALKLLLGDIERTKLFERLLALNDLEVAVLVLSDQTVDLNFILGNHGHHLMALSLPFATVALVFKRHINCVIIVRVRVLVVTCFRP